MKITIRKIMKYRKRIFREAFKRLILFLYFKPSVRRFVNVFYRPKKPKKWVFIVGCYNSGTTLLQRLISKHPQISTLPREGVRLTSYLPQPESFGWTRMWCKCKDKVAFSRKKEPDKIKKILRDWAPFFSSKCSVFLEKSIANITKIEWIEENLENVYFLGIVRDPYATASGIRKRVHLKGDLCEKYGNFYPIEFTAQQWKESNEILKDAPQKLQKFHCVSYENLTCNPLEELTKIFKFLDLEPPKMSWENNKLRVLSYGEIIFNKNRENIQLLNNEEKVKIWNIVGNLAENLNYAKI